MPTNFDRATWAESAVKQYINMTGTDQCSAVADLLGDLMHLCRLDTAYGDFSAALEIAEHGNALEMRLPDNENDCG